MEIFLTVLEVWNQTGAPPEEHIDPEIEVWESPELPGDLAGRGWDNMLRVVQTLSGSFQKWSFEPGECFDLGERVLAFVRVRAIGRDSGAEVEAPQAYLVRMRDGKVIEWGLFGDRSKALEAAGLRPRG